MTAELRLRTHIMQLFKKGYCWRDAMVKLAVMFESAFQLKSIGCTQEAAQNKKKMENIDAPENSIVTKQHEDREVCPQRSLP